MSLATRPLWSGWALLAAALIGGAGANAQGQAQPEAGQDPPAAALLAYGAAGAAAPEWRWGAALLAGGVALTAHGTKASARAAVNSVPEPFSNWALSFGEDVLAVWLTWMATAHPLAAMVIVVILVAISAFLLFHLFRFVRRALREFLDA